MKTRFIAVLAACLFLAIAVVAGGNGKGHEKEHGHHGGPHGYGSPSKPHHP